MDLTSSRHRLLGYKMALEQHSLAFDSHLLMDGDYSEAAGYMAAAPLIARGADAVFAANDTMAVGLMRAVIERGLRVPDDIAIIGFDDLPIASTIMPALSTVRQPIHDLGVAATELLIGIIDGQITSPQHIMLPTQLIIRQSSGAPNC
jgi:DNA-binding LacI/PurR family transcriptional regulator